MRTRVAEAILGFMMLPKVAALAGYHDYEGAYRCLQVDLQVKF